MIRLLKWVVKTFRISIRRSFEPNAKRELSALKLNRSFGIQRANQKTETAERDVAISCCQTIAQRP